MTILYRKFCYTRSLDKDEVEEVDMKNEFKIPDWQEVPQDPVYDFKENFEFEESQMLTPI